MTDMTYDYIIDLDNRYGPTRLEDFPNQPFAYRASVLFHVGYLDLEPWQRSACRADHIFDVSEKL